MASLDSLEIKSGKNPSQGASRLFSMRIVNLDYYMATPLPGMDHSYSQFQGRSVLEVPVIRVYGSTLAGQKTCLHIHKVLPYFYVPYDEDLPQKLDDAMAYVRHLAFAIEKAMKLATNIGAKRQHVHTCGLVRGKKFYGFHRTEQFFIKIVLYYPQEVARISTLLLGGGILNRRFEPHESHIPYLLQFMVDNNLSGMSHIHLSKLIFRQPLPEKPREMSHLLHSVLSSAEAALWQEGVACNNVVNSSHLVSNSMNGLDAGSASTLHDSSEQMETCSEVDKSQEFWLASNIPSDWIWPFFTSELGQDFGEPGKVRCMPSRSSTSELEADASAEEILNKTELQYVPLQLAGPHVKMVQSLIPIWQEEYLRSGDHGPASSGANCPSFDRVLSSSISYQDNFRKALLEVIRKEEMHFLPVKDSFLKEQVDGIDSLHQRHALENVSGVAPAERERILQLSIKSVDPEKNPSIGSPKNPSLYEITQPAHGKSSLEIEPCEELEARIIIQDAEEWVGEGTLKNGEGFGGFLGVKDMPFPLNEELIRAQLTESQLKEEEKEALDLLQWMMDDQTINVDEDENADENRDDEANLSQIAKSEGVEAVLRKSMCNYEISSQQECESILESLEASFHAASNNFNLVRDAECLNKSGTCGKSTSEPFSTKIPQSYDEADIESLQKLCESRRDLKDLNVGTSTSKDALEGPADLTQKELKIRMPQQLPTSSPVGQSSSKWGPLPVVTGGTNQPSGADTKHIEKALENDPGAYLDESLKVLKKHKRGCAYLTETKGVPEQKGSGQSIRKSPSLGGFNELSVRDLMRYKREKRPLRRDVVLCDETDVFENSKREASKQTGGDSEATCDVTCMGDETNVFENTKSEISKQSASESEAIHKVMCATTQEQATMSTSKSFFEGEVMNDAQDFIVASSRLSNAYCPPEGQLLLFHKRPPTQEQLLRTFQDHSLKPVNYGCAFYGDARQVPARPSVMAGLMFDVRSRSGTDLHDFQFDGKSVEDAEDREYIEMENWEPQGGVDTPIGGYSYYENDGTLLFLLTPVQPPPILSPLVSFDKPTSVEAGKQVNLLEEVHITSEMCVEFPRPASPKYDEKHVLNHEIQMLTPFSNRAFLQSSVHVSQAQDFQEICSHGSKSALQHHQHEIQISCERFSRDISQITAPPIASTHTMPLSQAGFRDPATLGGGQQVTMISIEMHAQSRGDLRPDPRYDSVCCIIIVVQIDSPPTELAHEIVVLLCDSTFLTKRRNLDGFSGCRVITLPDEVTLFQCFTKIVSLYDPDMLVGWEVQGHSLGFLAERAANLGIGILKQLSRSLRGSSWTTHTHEVEKELVELNESVIEDEWGRTHGSGIHIGGRIILNLWRIIRGELKLGIYTLEAVAEAVLRRRVPRIPWRTLTQWFMSGPGRERFRCVEYLVERAKLNLQIMDQLDLVNRTAELARIFGIDFYSVLSRGSQYRVESMMLRLAHTQNFLLISPTRQQVFAQPAMECLPLVMEPESRFYTSPVVVLDFQSLYPSIVIAYNLCFSTCLGKIGLNNPKILGVTSLFIEHGLLSELKDILTIAPNGVLYVPPEVSPGVLPRLLEEILSTRIMVKQAMKKLSSSQRVMQRVLNARQAALKLIANVTYGYAAAGFSGRMPCAELADSIVQFGRHTLEQAIQMVNVNPQWDARVVYGDTDSMFVLLEGRTREEAFKIGQEIAAAVTKSNPHPVTLKMEKVYQPCVLLTKKRYVGYSFENVSQLKPNFDAKGIETVRRDSCGAVVKCMERSLRILFETSDLSQVRQYLERQLQKILQGRISLKDFIFAKEVRLGTYSTKASVLPPAAIVASKAMAVDPRAEPRFGERVQYVVVHGEPGARLVDMVVDPHILLDNPAKFRLHDTYYINKQIIPALQRIFGLVGADLKAWYSEMSRVYRPSVLKRPSLVGVSSLNANVRKGDSTLNKVDDRIYTRGTIDQYYLSQHCTVCGQLTKASQVVCNSCSENQIAVTTILTRRFSQLEKEFDHLQALCRHCGGSSGGHQQIIACISLECPIFFERRKAETHFEISSYLAEEQC
ncbi:hypothetical protein O6H91_08G065000 [Diphasiastrum complanatum]|uniref:Uncharacterized protein n=1 Tax=Diphasiastrum complanatum TaxID=34168 RepID=A0ACC2CYC3_DIPCM|nr:hypothetical protein O6H91_08G065000 [Diphasiastrum complanatum]